MVEAKLRVEMSERREDGNPYYGNTIAKKVTEETFIHDFDNRKNIAPYGINAILHVECKDSKDNVFARKVFDIKINRYYLENEYEDNHYSALFDIDGKIYEVYVEFGKNGIEDILLSEWLSQSFFEDGYDADNIYYKEDFVTYVTYNS